MNKITSQGQILIPFAHSSCLLPGDSAGRIARELWWTNQEFSSADIILPPLFSMLVYQLGVGNMSIGDCSSSHHRHHHHTSQRPDLSLCDFKKGLKNLRLGPDKDVTVATVQWFNSNQGCYLWSGSIGWCVNQVPASPPMGTIYYGL
jgi:hypothetical protein